MACMKMFKCGDLMLVKELDWTINFKCGYCDEIMYKLESFLKHTLTHLIEIEDVQVTKIIDGVLNDNNNEEFQIEELKVQHSDEICNKTKSGTEEIEEYLIKVEQTDENLNSSFEELSIELLLNNAIVIKDELLISNVDKVKQSKVEQNDNFELINRDLKLHNLSNNQQSLNALKKFEIEFYKNPKPTTTTNKKVANYEDLIFDINTSSNDGKCDYTPNTAKLKKLKKTKSSSLTAENNEPFKCPQCTKYFQKARSLKRHLLTHSTQKPFSCDFCDATFADGGNYNVHRKRHLGIHPHCCKICEKRFTTTTDLNTHMRCHTDQRPFVCDICGKTYKSKQQVERHISRYHANERNFSCDICEKKFYDRKTLNDHYISHTDERPFECEICNKTFSRKKALVQHSKLHSDIYEYQCPFCEKSFQQRPGLHSHIKNIHKQ